MEEGIMSRRRLLNIKVSSQGFHPITQATNEDQKAFTPCKGLHGVVGFATEAAV